MVDRLRMGGRGADAAGPRQQAGDADRLLKEVLRRGAVALAVQAVVAVHVAVIGGVHHQRVLLGLLIGQLVEHAPRHLVDHADRRVVLGVGLAPLGGVGRVVEAGAPVRTARRQIGQDGEAALVVTLHPALRLAGMAARGCW